jgi:hypothetical protein
MESTSFDAVKAHNFVQLLNYWHRQLSGDQTTPDNTVKSISHGLLALFGCTTAMAALKAAYVPNEPPAEAAATAQFVDDKLARFDAMVRKTSNRGLFHLINAVFGLLDRIKDARETIDHLLEQDNLRIQLGPPPTVTINDLTTSFFVLDEDNDRMMTIARAIEQCELPSMDKPLDAIVFADAGHRHEVHLTVTAEAIDLTIVSATTDSQITLIDGEWKISIVPMHTFGAAPQYPDLVAAEFSNLLGPVVSVGTGPNEYMTKALACGQVVTVPLMV